MSYVLDPLDDEPAPPPDGRALAMLNYSLMFISSFLAGVPALIAVALAYAQRSKAPPVLRSHFKFQIALFWLAFMIAVVAGALALTGVVLAVAELITSSGANLADGFHLSDLRVAGWVFALLVGGFLLAVGDALMLMVASAVGFIRLASNRPFGK